MRMKSVSGITCTVADLSRTVEFYEKLGFTFRKREAEHATAYLNWFWLDFTSAQAQPGSKGAGLSIGINVEDVDEFYQGLLAEGFKPVAEPINMPGGNREFLLHDPDGYQLVFFKRK